MQHNYAPHILTAKVNLSGIPKGSRLVYASDDDNRLTYHNGSQAVVLNLSEATNGEYFDLQDTPEVAIEAPSTIESPAVPKAPRVEPSEPLLARLVTHNRVFLISLGAVALIRVSASVVGGADVAGFSILSLVLTAGYLGGVPLLVRKLVNHQLSKGLSVTFTAILIIGLLIVGTEATGEKVIFSPLDWLCFFLAYRIMRIGNNPDTSQTGLLSAAGARQARSRLPGAGIMNTTQEIINDIKSLSPKTKYALFAVAALFLFGTLFALVALPDEGRYRVERSGNLFTKTDTATGGFWIFDGNNWTKPEKIKPQVEVLDRLPPGYVIDSPKPRTADDEIRASNEVALAKSKKREWATPAPR